MLEHSVKCRIW